MTDVKWSALTAVTDLQDTDILSLVRSTANNKITGANLKAQIVAEATNATQAELDAVATASVAKTLYDANTVLAATSDNTPAALTMGASTILARLAAGNIVAATVAEIATLLGPSLPGKRLDYAQITTNATSTQTVEASATTVINGNSITYDGTMVRIRVCAAVFQNSGTPLTHVNIWRDSTDLGRAATIFTNAAGAPCYGEIIDTPSAAAHTYSARMWVSGASTATMFATAPYHPAFLEVLKV